MFVLQTLIPTEAAGLSPTCAETAHLATKPLYRLDFSSGTSVTGHTLGLPPGQPRYKGQRPAGLTHPRNEHAQSGHQTATMQNQGRELTQCATQNSRCRPCLLPVSRRLASPLGSSGTERTQESRIYERVGLDVRTQRHTYLQRHRMP